RAGVGAVAEQPRYAGDDVAIVAEVERAESGALGRDGEGVAHAGGVLDLFPAWLVPGEPYRGFHDLGGAVWCWSIAAPAVGAGGRAPVSVGVAGLRLVPDEHPLAGLLRA